MKNRFLISFLTLIVFFNFTIPSYALATSRKAFSRKAKAAPTEAKAVSEPVQAEVIPAYTIPESSAMQELPSYSLPNSANVAAVSSTLRYGMVTSSTGVSADENAYVEGQFFIKFKNPSENPKLFDNLSAGEVFSASPSLAKIAIQYDIRSMNIKRLFSSLTDSSVKDIREKASMLKNVFTFISYADDSSKLLEDLGKEPNVIYVERVPKVKTFYVPNDPQYVSQWYLTKIQASQAWDIYNANTNNAQVVLAVVDDAVKLGHEDLQANIWVNPGEIFNNGIDDDGNGYVDDINGWDVAMNDNNPNPPSTATNDYFMHGTHVAGIAAATSNNTTGISSISGAGQNKVKIMAVKTAIDTSTNGELQATLEGVQYAIAAGANVINMSWGSSAYSNVFQDLFITARSLGVVLVAAAGNESTNHYRYPASYLYVISVGATEQGDQKANFSNYGYQIDVMAPGKTILSTLPVNNNSYGNLDGTSMASPLVAGLAGLMRSYNNSLTPHQVEVLMEQNCDNINAQNSDYIGRIGAGRINANNIFQDLQLGAIPADEEFSAIVTSLPAVSWGNISWGDYDSDGKLDIITSGLGINKIKIYHNNGLVNGQWQFTDSNIQIPGVPFSDVVWGDYDNDGKLDFAVGGNNTLKIYHNNGLVNGQWQFTQLTCPYLMGDPEPSLTWGDYDNDGRLDLASFGIYHVIYHNNGLVNGQWQFLPVYISGLPDVSWGDCAWGDYDNDGKPDLVVTGGAIGAFTAVYHNDGAGPNNTWIFSNINANVINLGLSSVDWGDYDNDGDLDMLIGGCIDPTASWGDDVLRTKVYRNDGPGVGNQWQFTDINAAIAPVYSHGDNLAWGDYDNDGDLDILATGHILFDEPQHSTLKVYKNDSGVFSTFNTEFIGVSVGQSIWGDYDNDGKLDILSQGQVDTGDGSGIPGVRLQIYHNDTVLSNSVPNSPSDLQSSLSGSSVALSWQKATDAQTPQNGLSYNIYMGAAPSTINKVSPMAQMSDGWRQVAAMGPQRAISNSNTVSYTVKDLACGTTYYWGVQAIDTALAGSVFAAGTPFTTDACPGSTYTVSGVVMFNSLGLANVEIKEGNTVLATTNSGGVYSFTKPSGWSGTITPSKSGYTFIPSSRSYNNLNSNQTSQNYTASLLTYTVSGTVLNAGGQVIAGATVNGQAVNPTTGAYSFTVNHGQNLTVTPSATGYTFTPPSATFNNITSNQTQNFVGSLLTYTVSGTVLDANSNPIAGATINGQDVSSGSYLFTVNYGDDITLAPQTTGYTFAPPSATFTNITENKVQNFVGNLLTYTVSGTVKDAANNVITGAMVNGQAVASDGSYSFTVNYGQNLTLTPAATGYTFTPPSATFTNIVANQTQNFVGTIAYFSISGSVYTPNAPGVGFAINVTNTNPNLPAVMSTFSQSDGSYSLSVPYGWSGSVQAVKAGYIVVDPQNGVRSYDNVMSHQTEMNYKTIFERYTVSGIIKYFDGSGPVADVQLKDDANNLLAITASDGSYSFEEDYGWSGIVRPYKNNHIFDPVEREYISLQSNQVEQHYKAKKESVVISGQIVSWPNDMPVGGVTLRDNEGTIVATTNAEGKYHFEKPIGWSGIVTPTKPRYAFTPKQRKYQNVQVNLSQEHYVARFEGAISHH